MRKQFWARTLTPVALAAILSLALAASPSAAQPEDVGAVLTRARESYEKADFQAACQAYRHANELSQERSAAAWLGLARCQLRLGESAAAIASARQAQSLAATPAERGESAGVLASALLKGDAPAQAEAIDLLRQARASAGDAQANQRLLAGLLALGRDHEAADLLRELRAGGASEGDLRLLLCTAAPEVNPADDADVQKLNTRLLAIDPAAALVLGGRIQKLKPVQVTKTRLAPWDKKKITGPIVVRMVVDRDGKVHDALVESGASEDLVKPVLSTVRSWEFRPATLDGKPVPVCNALVWHLHALP